ncbi:DUF2735 domain-containing protein [Bradyrhizobium sp.]|uniref:DUF2735 domain-containing protein n=1 Tax=Bradyrhizobium sp. TaxID=376 RepID=UPI0023A3AF02|nr:DUF2735 domain-containing protein [Bradyrhizobium sp.]MDE1936275.1 DUF2735 domain-containing protein [Bradyrhizobium sp.]MDE2064596.1 DUF2735 domain-containing protein [Bradyrhizobium sp.]
MSTNHGQGSARIFQFPAGGRAALGGKRREDFDSRTDASSERVNETACSGNWYHEAAIREAAERGLDH